MKDLFQDSEENSADFADGSKTTVIRNVRRNKKA